MAQSLPTSSYPTVPFKREGATHSLLCLVQVMSRPGEPGCSVDDALHILGGKFSSRTKVERSAEVLFKNKYAEKGAEDRWFITNEGHEALLIATRNVLKG